MKIKTSTILGAVALLFISTAQSFASAPPNDYYTNRIALSGSLVELSGSTDGATWLVESIEEPSPRITYWCNTIWWSWTAQESGPVIIEKLGGNDPITGGLAVWTGTNFSYQTMIFQGAIDLTARGQYMVFSAEAGTEYQIAIGGIIHSPVSFRLTMTNAPMIRLQPQTQTVSEGASVLFTISAVGVNPLHYQWQRDGVDLLNATNQMLAFDGCSLTNAAGYRAVVTSASGASTSVVAQLYISTNDIGPRFTAVGSVDATNLQFTIEGDEGRYYRQEYAPDLKSWQRPGVGVILNTNTTTTFQIPMDWPAKFVRLSAYHPADEICLNNLKKIRFSIWQWVEENHKSDFAAVGIAETIKYFGDEPWPQCPLADPNLPWWFSYNTLDAETIPVCFFSAGLHRLEDSWGRMR